MRPALALLTALAAFGCTTSQQAFEPGAADRGSSRSVRVLEDVNAMQQGMDHAVQSERAGL